MITITLKRTVLTAQRTIGTLVTPSCNYFTMEDVVREQNGVPVNIWKVHGETAIPRGTYDLLLTFSNRFQKPLPQLMDVPGFSGVRIHAGNTEKDTEGCILIGLAVNSDATQISNSRAAMMRFMDDFEGWCDAGIPVQIEIK